MMKRHIGLSLLFLVMFTRCTIQKRLYNKGYHIEHKTKFRTDESVNFEDSLTFKTPIAKIKMEDNIVFEESFQEMSKKVYNDTESVVLRIPNHVIRDTTYVVTKEKSLNKKKKHKRLLATGIPMIGLGLLSVGALSAALVEGASLFTVVVIGAIGYLFAGAAIILLIFFLVFLCTPAEKKHEKKNMEVKAKEKKEPKLTKGERGGLTLAIVLMSVIGFAFLASYLLKN